MIQRIQTVYLTAAVGVCVAGLVLVDHLPGASSWVGTAAMAGLGLSGAAALVSVFLFRQRQRQRQGILLAQYVMLVSVAASLFGAGQALRTVSVAGIERLSWVVIALPVVGFALLHLARRGVDADIRLLKSVDRLR